MDFAYYVVRREDMVIIEGAKDVVSAINIGQQQGCPCLVLQACVITEIGPDPSTMTPEEVPGVEVEDNEFENDTLDE